MKAIMLSIQPKWCELIASGRKTIEVRKSRPKLETPFKCYIYEIKAKGLFVNCGRQREQIGGKVIGEFVCDRIEKYDYFIDKPLSELIKGQYRHYLTCGELERTCLSARELEEYLREKDGYGWHISDLKIYDTPKELGEFRKPCPVRYDELYGYDCLQCDCLADNDYGGVCTNYLTRPPQSWCYVEADA